MPNLTLKGIALGWSLSAACVVVDCGSKTEPHALSAGASGSGGAQGGTGARGGTASGMAGNSGDMSAPSGGGAGRSDAGAGGAQAAAGEGGEGAAAAAGVDATDAASDATEVDAQSDASEGGGAGSPNDGGTDSAPPKDAAPPPMDCALPEEPPDDAGAATRQDVQEILNTRCAQCHTGPTPPMGLRLSDISLIVGTPSVECPTKLRIQPGSAQNSYLVDKLLGRSQTPCGCFDGQRMPEDDDPLDDDLMRTIRSWINAGAH